MENQNLSEPVERDHANSNHPEIENDEFIEETAAEVSDLNDIRQEDIRSDDDHDDLDVKSAYGWVALALSVISFFIVPILFAVAGIIVGFVARNRSAPLLGNTAIIVGVLSLVIRLFIMPLI